MSPFDSTSSSADTQPADPLEQLVARAIALIESEGEAGFERLLAENPVEADSIRTEVEALRRAGLLGGQDRGMPQRLGGFRILDKLGDGGMGVVYLAEQEELGRRVALKLIRPEYLHFDSARQRFFREAEAVARLQHPSIVPIYTVGADDGIPFFAMELIAGCTLSELLEELAGRDPSQLSSQDLFAALRSRRPDLREEGASPSALEGDWVTTCCLIGEQVAEALEHAHTRGVLHRDVKLSNVMLTPSGRALLTDFGLARTEGASPLTEAGALLGSLPYMAPEQVDAADSATDGRSDVYSLGVALFELLALRRPFTASSRSALIEEIYKSPPPNIRQLNPKVPADLRVVLEKALEKDPDARYRSPRELGEDLRRVREIEPISARPASVGQRLSRWTRRNPALALSLSAAGLFLVVGLVVSGVLLSETITQRDRADAKTKEARGEARRALEEKKRADEKSAEAQREAERARRRFVQARDAARFVVQNVSRRLEHVLGAQGLRQEVLQSAYAQLVALVAEEADDERSLYQLAETHNLLGDIAADMGQYDAARQHQRDVMKVCAKGLEVLPGHHSFRHQISIATTLEARILNVEGEAAKAAKAYADSVVICRELAEETPEDPALFAHLGDALYASGAAAIQRMDYDLAESLLTEALAVKQAHPNPRRSEAVRLDVLSMIYGNLASADLQRRRFSEAAGHLEKRRKLVMEALEQEPANPLFRNTLGTTEKKFGSLALFRADFATAQKHNEAALAIFDELHRIEPEHRLYASNLAQVLKDLGRIRQHQGDNDGAIARYRESMEQLEKLLGVEPKNLELRDELCEALNLEAQALMQIGQRDKSKASLERALGIAEALVAADPDSKTFLTRKSTLLFDLGQMAAEARDYEEARRRYRLALDIDEALAAERPDDLTAYDNLITSYGMLGILSENLGDDDAARASFERTLELGKKALKVEPGNRRFRFLMSSSLRRLGLQAAAAGDLDTARAHTRQALELREKLVAEGQPSPQEIFELAQLLLEAPVPELKDAGRARKLAERVDKMTGGRIPSVSLVIWRACHALGDAEGAARAREQAFKVLPEGHPMRSSFRAPKKGRD